MKPGRGYIGGSHRMRKQRLKQLAIIDHFISNLFIINEDLLYSS